MSKVFLMKTFQKWFDFFTHENVIGLDNKESIDKAYKDMTDKEKLRIFSNLSRPGTYKKFFDLFTDEIEVNDIVILGTGQTTKFNVSAIAKVTGDYEFIYKYGTEGLPRHIRKVNMHLIDPTFQFDKWGWSRRIEKLDDSRMEEFAYVTSKIIF